MGRQRLGLLLLRNHPAFLQNIDLPPRLDTKLDVAALDITARWGGYARVPNDEHEHTKPRKNRDTGKIEETKVKVWRRSPRGGRIRLDLRDGVIKPLVPDTREHRVRIQGAVRTNAKGERLVTLFLVNGQLEPETNRDTACM